MKRRNFLLSSGLLAAGRFATAQQPGARLHAPGGEAARRLVNPADWNPERRQNRMHPAMKSPTSRRSSWERKSRNWVYVVLTDQGIYGIGEAYPWPDEATVKVIEDFKSWLIGNDPGTCSISSI
jgi:hypothetical protein